MGQGWPTVQSLREGTPSLGEVPSGGARALCLLWGFSKVSRRKGETHSCHDAYNGCVLRSPVTAIRLADSYPPIVPTFHLSNAPLMA